MFVNADLHIHSHYSKDSMLSPRKILCLAKKNNIGLVAITDHNTINGALHAKRYQDSIGVQVIIGAEIATDAGDIIGLCLTKEIDSRRWRDVIAEIRAQNGIVVLPHPYRAHKEIYQIAEIADYIEVFNSRCTQEQNQKANNLAAELNKKCIIGSDAHIAGEIGNCRMVISSDLKDVKEPFEHTYSKNRYIYLSQFIGLAREGRFPRIIYLSFRVIRLILAGLFKRSGNIESTHHGGK